MNHKILYLLNMLIFLEHSWSETLIDSEPLGIAQIQTSIELPLAEIERILNEAIPQTLTTIQENNRTCVDAKWAKTKIPTFKGLKIYTKTVKTKISPEIKCDVNGWVRRSGKISVSANGHAIRISMPVDAKVSAKALVRETATASAVIFADIELSLNQDWQPQLVVKPDFIWSEKPNLKLFGIIKVGITGKVEPHLRKELGGLSQSLVAEVGKFNIKQKLDLAWNKFQQPLIIDDNTLNTLHFQPKTISYSGFNIEGASLKANVIITGRTAAYLGIESPNFEKSSLPKLNKHEITDNDVKLTIPLSLSYSLINTLFNKTYPKGKLLSLGGETNNLSISDLSITHERNGRLRFTTKNKIDNRGSFLKHIDIFNWGLTSFNTSVIGQPIIDPETQTLKLIDTEIEFESNNRLVTKLNTLGAGKIISNNLQTSLVYQFSKDLHELKEKIQLAVNTQYGSIVSSGEFKTPQVENIIVLDGRLITTWSINGSSNIKLNL